VKVTTFVSLASAVMADSGATATRPEMNLEFFMITTPGRARRCRALALALSLDVTAPVIRSRPTGVLQKWMDLERRVELIAVRSGRCDRRNKALGRATYTPAWRHE